MASDYAKLLHNLRASNIAVRESLSLGLITPDELKLLGYLIEDDGELTGRPEALPLTSPEGMARAQSAVRVGRVLKSRLNEFTKGVKEDSAGETFFRTAFDGFWRETLGAAPALVEGLASVVGAEGVEGAARRGREFIMGSPEEQMLRQARGQANPTASLAGSIAGGLGSFMALMAVPGGVLGKVGATALGAGRAGKALGFFERTLVPLTGKSARFFLTGTAVSGAIGAAAGTDFMQMAGLYEADKHRNRLDAAMSNMGLFVAASTMLYGRPANGAVRAIRAAELAGGKAISRGASVAANRFALGTSLQLAPNLTVGTMARVGSAGAALMTLAALEEGSSPEQALSRGVHYGLVFAGYDVAFARLGALRRVSLAQTVAARSATQKMLALGIQPAALAGAGAAVGSTVAALTDNGDPGLMALAGAAAGAAIGGVGAARTAVRAKNLRLASEQFLEGILGDTMQTGVRPEGLRPNVGVLQHERDRILHEAASVLPRDVVKNIERAKWESISREDMASLSELLTDSAWRQGLDAVVEGAAQAGNLSEMRAAEVMKEVFSSTTHFRPRGRELDTQTKVLVEILNENLMRYMEASRDAALRGFIGDTPEMLQLAASYRNVNEALRERFGEIGLWRDALPSGPATKAPLMLPPASGKPEVGFRPFFAMGEDGGLWVPNETAWSKLKVFGIEKKTAVVDVDKAPVVQAGLSIRELLEVFTSTTKRMDKRYKRGRESFWALDDQGNFGMAVGQERRVGIDNLVGRFASLRKEPYDTTEFIVTAHSHPPYKPGSNEYSLYLRVANHFFSKADVATFHRYATKSEVSFNMVLSPERTVTLLRTPRITSEVEIAGASSRFLNTVDEAVRDAIGSRPRNPDIPKEELEALVERVATRLRMSGYAIETNIPIGSIDERLAAYVDMYRQYIKKSFQEQLDEGVVQDGSLLGGRVSSRDKKVGETFTRILREEAEKAFGEEFGQAARVARAAARAQKEPAAESITAQASTGAGISLRSIEEEIGKKITKEKDGWRVDPGGPLFPRLSDLRKFHLNRTDVLGGPLAPVAALVAAAGGGLIGGVLEQELRDLDDESSTVLGAFAGAGIAGLATLAMAAKGRATGLEKLRQILVKSYGRVVSEIPEAEKFTYEESRRLTGFGKPKMPALDWHLMHPQAQVEHAVKRIEAVVNRFKDGKQEVRQQKLRATLLKYTPSVPWEANQFDLMETAINQAGAALKMGRGERERMWRGWLEQTATDPTLRSRSAVRNLLNIDGPVTGSQLHRINYAQQVRDTILTANVTGAVPLNVWIPQYNKAMAGMRKRTLPSAKSSFVDTVMSTMKDDLPQGGILAQLAADEFLYSGFRSDIRGPEQWRTLGERLVKDPATRKAGELVLQLYNVGNATLLAIQRDAKQGELELNKIFYRFKPWERLAVRHILEGDPAKGIAAAEFRTKYKDSDRLNEAAVAYDKYLKTWGTKAGVPEQRFIEDYFTWFYSQRSISEIRRTNGLIPGEPLQRGYSGLPENKFFYAMMPRGDRPLGHVIEDPLLAGQVYLNGAIRKYWLDTMSNSFGKDSLKDLSKVLPNTANGMARWYLDIWGVPRSSSLAAKAWMRGMGTDVEAMAALMGLHGTELAERLILGAEQAANPAKIGARLAGFQFFAKLGFNFMSSVVNASQYWLNTAPEVGALNAFISAGSGFQGATARVAEQAPYGMDKILLPILDPFAKGRSLLTISRGTGMLSPRYQDVIRDVAEVSYGGDKRKVIFDGMRTLLTFSFTGVEFLNRVGTVAATERFARTQTGRLGEILDTTLLGAVGGAASGYSGAEEGEGLEGALSGAAIGAAFGAGIGALGKTPKARRMEMERSIRKYGVVAHPGGGGMDLAAATRVSEADLRKLMIEQVVQQTQFLYTRGHRPYLLRSPMGQALGALQTFTINQSEYVGARLGSFVRDMKLLAAGKKQPGDVDTRVLKYGLVMWGLSGVYTSLFGFAPTESTRDANYWVSRIGMGLLPFLRYNASASQWQVENPLQQAIAGPVISDVMKATTTMWYLATSTKARSQYDKQLDDLARQVFTFYRSNERAPETVGAVLEMMGAENLAEDVRSPEMMNRAYNFGHMFGAMRELAGGQRTPTRDKGRASGSTNPFMK